MLSSFSVVLSVLACLCTADAKTWIPYATISSRPIPFYVPRGGTGNANEEGGHNPSQDLQLFGVIDLRPEPEPDSIVCGDNRATFPAPQQEEDVEELMDQHAASSHAVGQLCSTVYLLITYDYDEGKTVLHRTLGGAKLMAFVDGVRGRRHEMGASERATKLVLVLVPSPSSSVPTSTSSDDETFTALNPPKDGEDLGWNASGVNFLVSRLSEAFALGGEEYRNMQAFDVEMIGASGSLFLEGEEEGSAGAMIEIVARHAPRTQGKSVEETTTHDFTPNPDEFQDVIQRSYKSAGGAGQISFQ